MEDELEITQENFDQYFHDVRTSKPMPGHVMAVYRAVAQFCEGPHKRDVINLLQMDKARQAAAVMRKIHMAREPDCYRICREMCEDLLTGMTVEEVEHKPYEFVLEAFYYTKKEHIPKNDPHWEAIQVMRWDPEKKTFMSEFDV